MISAIGPIGKDYTPEYLQIMKELQKYGITATGNERIDKARLQEAKKEEAEKVVFEKIESKPEHADKEREQLEELRTGAMNLAQINKILLGI